MRIVPNRCLLVARGLSVAAVLAASSPALAQYDVRGYVSSSGLDFVAEQVPSLVPTGLDAPELSRELACITATQRNTHIELQVDDFALTIPQEGSLRLFIELSAQGDGEVFIDNAIACLGSLTCQDHIELSGARATIDFDVALEGGRPSIVFRAVDLELSEDDIVLQFSGCAVGDVATAVIGFAKQFIIDFLLEKAEEIAVQELGPLLETTLGSFGTSFSGGFSGPFGTYEISASLDNLIVRAGGIELGANLDLSSPAEANECVAEFDDGAPGPREGDALDLAEGPAHLGLAVNLGLVENALYQVWRQGLTCITGDTLEALGIELPIDEITALLPGFPPGSTLSVEARLTRPPRVSGAATDEDGVALSLAVDGVEVVLRGQLPDRSERVIQVGVDVEATAAVGVDRESNALVATPEQVTLKRMEMDQVTVTELGFDVARMTEVIRDHMMPKLLGELGTLPVTGPVFQAGPLPFAVILRGMDNSDAYMSVYADLYRIPDGDVGAPETSIIDYPSGVVSPSGAVVKVNGVDGIIPAELLQYRVSIDGIAAAPSYLKRFAVGEVGKSGTYDVQVAAVDLSGNADPSPASVQIEVDGIGPEVLVAGERVRKSSGGPSELIWTMEDDRTPPTDLAPRIELYKVTDPADLLAVELVRTFELTRGATSGVVEIEDGALYRAELHVADNVGNETTSAVLLDASPADGGCSAGGRTGAAGSRAVFFLALGLVRRQPGRRSSK